ncbi:hypothetical protein E2C01_020988 [Portunus trituberculatus]|uniref:Uncharacterized protein n=1 Tax=Portunus trituberculatus TaxID=210409 RepID=A0A5B7E4W3_PORTR|nr:hypothetical protein [Portunus trituberculatus]
MWVSDLAVAARDPRVHVWQVVEAVPTTTTLSRGGVVRAAAGRWCWEPLRRRSPSLASLTGQCGFPLRAEGSVSVAGSSVC